MVDNSNSPEVQLSMHSEQCQLADYIAKKTNAAEADRPRISLDGAEHTVNPTGLIKMQLDSYSELLQQYTPAAERKPAGLHAAFQSVFPIVNASGHIVLEYVDYEIGEPVYDVESCLLRTKTYSAPLQVRLRYIVYDKEQMPESKVVKNITEQVVYMGELPLMTPTGALS